MQAYKHTKAYIIAEGPMASTARNMWKVIHDRKCGAIVMLSDLVENGMASKNTCISSKPAVIFLNNQKVNIPCFIISLHGIHN